MEAYLRVRGPVGPWRADYQAAIVAWAVVASNSKRPRRYKIDHFIPNWGGGSGPGPYWVPDDEPDDDPDDPDVDVPE